MGKFFPFNISNLPDPSNSDPWRDSIRFNVLDDGISLIPWRTSISSYGASKESPTDGIRVCHGGDRGESHAPSSDNRRVGELILNNGGFGRIVQRLKDNSGV